MGFLDKASAKVGEVTKAAQDGLADQQAKRKSDGLLRELGAWHYAKHKGGFEEADENIARVLGERRRTEGEHGGARRQGRAAAPAPSAAGRDRPRGAACAPAATGPAAPGPPPPHPRLRHAGPAPSTAAG